MKDSTCLSTNRLNGYRAIFIITVMGITGCVGPGNQLASFAGLSSRDAATAANVSQGHSAETYLEPETSSANASADQMAQVSHPMLPAETDYPGDRHSFDSNYDLSQPVDPQSMVQQLTAHNTVGSGINPHPSTKPSTSPYYTKPTSNSFDSHQAEPESVYQLLEGLEPGSASPSTESSFLPASKIPASPLPADPASRLFTSDKRYVARQFPTTGQPIAAAPQQRFRNRAANVPATAPPAGTPLPAPPATHNPTAANTQIRNPANLLSPNNADPYTNAPPSYAAYQGPRVREADLIINGFPARTGRIMLGGAVNSDAGITGQLTIDERNFDITRWPRSFRDMFSGTAFRGAGQTFRLEAAPGSIFKRYTLQFADPNLLGYLPISMSVSGFLYDRRFDDWDEERLGGRLSFGYRITPDLSISAGVTGQNVAITDPRILGEPQLDAVLGDNGLWGGEVSLKHDTRNTPIQASEGHYLEFSFEEVFGDYEYSRFELEGRQYWLLNERADGSGRQTLSFSTRLGFSGKQTPIFENFFAGGYATMRGFEFRGASPVGATGVELGGRFQWLNTLEYMFPLTADDAFAGVAFMDFGTVEENIEINADNFRVAPGVGLRIAIPMLGPAPLAFDFAFPVAKADTDQERIFSFYMSMVR